MPPVITPDQVKFYKDNGYLIIENFATPQEVNSLRNDVKQLINSNQNPSLIEAHVKLMGTKYHLDSVDETYFFYEKKLVNNGQLTESLEKCIHKIAHGVHLKCDGAKNITFSEKVKEVIKNSHN